MSSGFGNWTYENPNNPSSNDNNTNGGEGGLGMTLPLFQNNNIPSDLGWSNIKSTMEAQMPQKVLGMNYQERFRVSTTLFSHTHTLSRVPVYITPFL